MEDIAPRTAAAIWWAFMWRGFIIAGLLGGTVGLIIEVIARAMHWPELVYIGSLLGLVAGLVGSWLSLHLALQKRYKGMRVILADIESAD